MPIWGPVVASLAFFTLLISVLTFALFASMLPFFLVAAYVHRFLPLIAVGWFHVNDAFLDLCVFVLVSGFALATLAVVAAFVIQGARSRRDRAPKKSS